MSKKDNLSQAIKEKISGKVILITGGTGSFGSIVINNILKLDPKRIIIFSRDEKKQFDMRNKYDSSLLRFVIGDVRDRQSVDEVMDGVDYVFHAAALKQVPSCEFFPLEAIKTNVLGASNVLTSAREHKAKKVMILSTDKAVYPINAMGMTKALMEKVMIAQARDIINGITAKGRDDTTLCGVRYGNVLYSRGSVIPYFVDQIKKGKELTVTNLNMTRFLLPLTQAVDLVLYALAFGENGHMYVRKAPAATLEILVQAICKIFSYKKGYREVGIRAGEKMHETLISKEEFVRAIDQGNYYKIPHESQGLDYNKYLFKGDKADIHNIEPYTSANTARLNLEQTIKLLLALPEIQHELKFYKSNMIEIKEEGVYTVID
ncbi:MAG: polysaccharide biosynthesis protein [Candidatus Levyibacteriota bacterium]